MKLLIVDNNDSFTYNLVQLVNETNAAEVTVHNHAEIRLEDVNSFDKIMFSPGPSLPDNFPIMKKILAEYGSKKNILGICMGLQAIAEHFGSELFNLDKPFHGQKHFLHIIKEDTIFNNVPQRTPIGLYHSWAVNKHSLSNELEVLAYDENGTIMAIRHKKFDIKGFQFHPESIITVKGSVMISNWINS